MTKEALLSAFGGPNALTKWSWLVAFPLGLLTGILWGLRYGLSLAQWAPNVLLGQIVVSLILLALRQGLLLAQPRITRVSVRAVLGLSAFALLGGLRVALILIAAMALGLEITWQTVWEFLPHGMASGVAILGVVSVVVDGSRRHAATMQSLTTTDAELVRLREFDEAGLAEVEVRAASDITRELNSELNSLRASAGGVDADISADVAAALRALATDLVRPLSHQLAADEPWMPPREAAGPPVSRSARLGSMVTQVRPAWPLAPVTLMALMGVPSEAVESGGGPLFGAGNVLLACLTLYAGSWLIARLWPESPTTARRLLGLVVAYLLVGSLATWQMTVLGRAFADDVRVLWITPVTFTVVAVGVSLLSAVDVQRRAAEDALAESMVRNAELTMQVRERSRRLKRSVAKFLHSDVQAELIATSMLLTGLADEALSDDERAMRASTALDRLGEALGERVRDQEVTPTSARERVLDLAAVWSSVLDLEVDVPADVWRTLDAHRDLLPAIDDIVSEGLTNAVCHGDSARVGLVMRLMGERLIVDVTSTGHLPNERREGLGSRFLTEASESWELVEDSGHIRLTATLFM